MISTAHKSRVRTTGLIVVAFYATVMVLAVACTFGDPAGGHDHHQHRGQLSHSALCLWACQANIGVGLVDDPDDGLPLVAVGESVALAVVPLHDVPLSLLHLRGPPLG
jgi:hypothetical protein